MGKRESPSRNQQPASPITWTILDLQRERGGWEAAAHPLPACSAMPSGHKSPRGCTDTSLPAAAGKEQDQPHSARCH